MTKIETYMEKAAASLAAATSVSTERERSFHHRAHCIWRRLVADAESAQKNPDAADKRSVKTR